MELPEETATYIARQAAIEALAEDILIAKQQVVDLDRKRNKNREALGAIRRKEIGGKKSWVCVGDLFVKLPQDTVKELIERDQGNLDAEIERLRQEMKEKTTELNQLEGNTVRGDPSRGFLLKSVDTAEARQFLGSG